jgi:hypothetical protein
VDAALGKIKPAMRLQQHVEIDGGGYQVMR